MTEISVFFLEPTDREKHYLRRYTKHDADRKCGKTGYCCNAMVYIGEADIVYTHDGYIKGDRRRTERCTSTRTA